VNLGAFSRDDGILGGVTLLLVIDLLFLPWFSISAGPLGSFTFTATDAPDALFGVLAVLAGILLIADLALERLSPSTQVPAINNSRTQTRFVLACVTALFVVLKFLFNIHFSDFGFGFWLAVILTAGLMFLALQTRNAPTARVGAI
jgi:hypothetical protein